MKIENWFLANTKQGGMVLPSDYVADSFYIVGKGYGKEGFEDGALIVTSKIVCIDSDKAITKSGSVYELGKMNEDYIKFINAYENNIPIIKYWEIEKGYLSGCIFKKGDYDTSWNIFNSELLGEIVSQDLEQNICEIETEKGNCKVFVDWCDIEFEQLVKMKSWSKEVRDSLKEFSHKRIIPDLFGKYRRIVRF